MPSSTEDEDKDPYSIIDLSDLKKLQAMTEATAFLFSERMLEIQTQWMEVWKPVAKSVISFLDLVSYYSAEEDAMLSAWENEGGSYF